MNSAERKIIRGAGARVGFIRAPAAELPEVSAAFCRRYVMSQGIDAAESVEAIVCVSQKPNDIVAVRRAAEVVIGDATMADVRRWLEGRTVRTAFERIRALCDDYNGWARRNAIPLISEKMLSQLLSKLGFRHRKHPRTRQSEFWLGAGLVEADR